MPPFPAESAEDEELIICVGTAFKHTHTDTIPLRFIERCSCARAILMMFLLGLVNIITLESRCTPYYGIIIYSYSKLNLPFFLLQENTNYSLFSSLRIVDNCKIILLYMYIYNCGVLQHTMYIVLKTKMHF